MNEILRPEFARFLLTGGFAALVNLGSRAVFQRFIPFLPAVALAYLCGMAVAYTLARKFVFTDAGTSTAESSFRFVVVNLLGIAQTTVVSWFLHDHALPALSVTFHPSTIAHLVGVATPVFTSFVAHRRWTFAKSSGDAT